MGRAPSGAAAGKPKRAPLKREAEAPPPPKKAKRSPVGAVEALERADDEQQELKRKKSWSGRTEGQAVEKILREQFNGWGQGAIDMVECDGLTLRARLHRDRDLWLRGQLEMGKLYYILQRERYSGISPELQVPVLSDADPGCPRLQRSIEKCFETVRDFQQLENWMETQSTVNQKKLGSPSACDASAALHDELGVLLFEPHDNEVHHLKGLAHPAQEHSGRVPRCL